MQALFVKRPLTSAEVLAVTAFLEDGARRGGQVPVETPLDFFLLGLGGTVAALGVFGRVWRFRFRAVRQPLVRESNLSR